MVINNVFKQINMIVTFSVFKYVLIFEYYLTSTNQYFPNYSHLFKINREVTKDFKQIIWKCPSVNIRQTLLPPIVNVLRFDLIKLVGAAQIRRHIRNHLSFSICNDYKCEPYNFADG